MARKALPWELDARPTWAPGRRDLEEIKRRQEYKKIVCDGTVTPPDIDISLGRQPPARLPERPAKALGKPNWKRTMNLDKAFARGASEAAWVEESSGRTTGLPIAMGQPKLRRLVATKNKQHQPKPDPAS